MARFTQIHEENSNELTGLPYNTVLGLSGILGIHSMWHFRKPRKTKLFITTFNNGVVEFEIETDWLKIFKIQVDFNTKIIKNVEIKGSGLKSGIGFDWLSSQRRYATENDFKQLVLTAWGDNKREKKYNGYHLWGKYGYLMTDPDEISDFKNIASEFDPTNKIDTLYKLQLNEEGHKFWVKKGFEWLGAFDLAPESESNRIFNEVKLRKEEERRKQEEVQGNKNV